MYSLQLVKDEQAMVVLPHGAQGEGVFPQNTEHFSVVFPNADRGKTFILIEKFYH